MITTRVYCRADVSPAHRVESHPRSRHPHSVCAWPVWASRQAATDDYSREPYVVERDAVRVAFDVDGTQTRDIEKRVRVQSAAALKEAGTLAVPYSRDLATVDLKYVRVRKPDGTVVETPLSSAIDLPAEVTRLAPTYTDIYFKQINVKGLAVGDTLDYALTIRTRSLIPGQFWEEHEWIYEGIVLAEDFEVSVPSSVTPKVKTVGDPQPTVETSAGRVTYRWHHTNLKSLSEKELALRNFARRNQVVDVRVSSFHNWADLGAAVRDLWRDRAQPDPRDSEQSARADARSQDRRREDRGLVCIRVDKGSVRGSVVRPRPNPAASGGGGARQRLRRLQGQEHAPDGSPGGRGHHRRARADCTGRARGRRTFPRSASSITSSHR